MEDKSRYDVENEGGLNGVNYKIYGNYDEFIGVLIRTSCACKFTIRHERFHDKLRKAIGAEYEFQTGNKKFDWKYFISGDSEAYKDIIIDTELQCMIEELEPFKALYVVENSIFLERITKNKDEFDGVDTKALVVKLIKMSKIFKGK
ncbi:MAG: hypothetical protein KAR42_14265 [candidate division Zixibacteria bacterium]|nr:hypothetical protein [candidate division Zixibacteria bacterium]